MYFNRTQTNTVIDRLKDIINNKSPFSDKNGNKFIVFNRNFLHNCYKYISPNTSEDFVADSTVENYMTMIRQNSAQKGFKMVDVTPFVKSGAFMSPMKGKMWTYICYNDDKGNVDFDLESAIESIRSISKTDKWYLVSTIYKIRDNVTRKLRVFNFIENFEKDIEVINKITNKENTPVSEASNGNPESIIKVEPKPTVEENPIDRIYRLMDNLDSISMCKNLVKLADYILETVDNKGIKVSNISKYYGKKAPVFMVNDNCGYPVVNSVDDIPSPFPEDKEQGDQKLANM